MARPPIVERLFACAHWIGARLRSRRFWRNALLAGVAGLVAIGYEASFRARLGSVDGRLPTALYTRPFARGSEERTAPIPIGTLQGDLGEFRVPIHLEAVPQALIQAVIAVEDQRFYEHHGLDARRIAGAAMVNVKRGAIAQGGSTITQQLAKNLFLTHNRTPLRKLREAAFALALEERYTKSTILEAYLNEIYLGQDGADAIHGMGAAAFYYFGKEIGDLSLGEAALLAGMIQAPNRYSPVRHPQTARRRRDLVLDLMVAQGRISDSEAEEAGSERVRTSPHPRETVDAPWFRDYVLADRNAAVRSLHGRGGAVFTTLDRELQTAANRAVHDGLAALPTAGAEAALVALDPHTGEVLAMVGGRDYNASQFNRATDALRQPGSAFKPIVALAALGRGDRDEPAYTLASVVRDEPLRLATPAGLWEPRNYDGQFHGAVTFREALEQSYNVPFARIGLTVGPERIVRVARSLGITSPLHVVPSLALGSSEVTLLELVRAFGVLAASGHRADLRALFATVDEKAGVRVTSPGAGTDVADPAETYLVTSALEGVVMRGTGRALADLAGSGGLAGKSGTSNDWRDAWFVAYTPGLVVGVWVGYDDGRSLRLTGAGAALPIVGRFLQDAFTDQGPESFEVPEGIETAHVPGTGTGWASYGCDGEPEVFLRGTAPQDACDGEGGRGSWSGAAIGSRLEALIEQFRARAAELAKRFGRPRVPPTPRGW